MRFNLFLLVTVIFTACGHQKIRFSKVKQQKVVEISEIPSLEKSSETALAPQTEAEETLIEKSSISSEVVDSQKLIEENTILIKEGETSTYFPEVEDDSTTVSAEDLEYMTEEAVRAEKLGTWSFITSLMIPAFFILSIILFAFSVLGGLGPVGAIFSVILAISTLVSIVLSYVFGISSLRAPYNTPKGRKFAIAGITISSSVLFLYLVIILLGV